MLYIKFNIQDSSKYTHFQKLFEHMVDTRKPGFSFEEELPVFDWDNLNDKEVDEALKKLDEFDDKEIQETNRYKELIPSYANIFFEKHLKTDNEKLGALGIQNVLSILNYLEYGFEVNIDNLEKLDNNIGIAEFSTGNFPFGGMERFLITLKAFDLIPIEYFDGFTIAKFDWTSDFEYNVTLLPEETKLYLKKI